MTSSRENPGQASCFRITEFDCWEPGRRVVLRIPRASPLAYVLNMSIFAVVLGAPAGFVLHFLFKEFVVDISYAEAMISTMIPLAMLGVIQIAAVDQAAKVEFDWTLGELRASSSDGRGAYRLETLQTLVVRGLYHDRLSHASGSSRTSRSERVYRARLEARFTDKSVRVLHTDSGHSSPEFAVSQLSPVAEELADALSVELLQEEPIREKQGGLLGSLAKAPPRLTALFVLLIAASSGWLLWRAQPALDRHGLRREVERRGGSVTLLNLEVADRNIGLVSGIHFSGGSIDDEALVELREALLDWEPFWLELSETRISDQGVQAVVGNQRLLAIDLRESFISDDGVQALSSCQSLLEVNLNRTRVTDESVVHLAKLPKLESLHLWGARISDESVPLLGKLSGLRELYLNETQVTPAGLTRLRDALPQTKIYP